MILLAPMEGVVDPIMRNILTRIGGFDFCATEFVRVTERLNPDHVFYKYCPELKQHGKTDAGTPVFVQLLGGKPIPMADNARKAVELGAPGIDINFGCPAKTVNRHDGGSVILQWPNRVYDITRAIRQAVPNDIPVTVKIRLGYQDASLALENAIAAEEAGAHWLTVHARTKVDGYKPPAHWDKLAPLKDRLKIPVIANGDIWHEDDAKKCKEITGCTDVMVGRGAIAQPYLASRIRSAIETEATEWATVLPHVHTLVRDSAEQVSPDFAVSRSKQWTRLLSRNFSQAEELFQNIKRDKKFEDLSAKMGIRPSEQQARRREQNG